MNDPSSVIVRPAPGVVFLKVKVAETYMLLELSPENAARHAQYTMEAALEAFKAGQDGFIEAPRKNIDREPGASVL